jgi:hypothetical protein
LNCRQGEPVAKAEADHEKSYGVTRKSHTARTRAARDNAAAHLSLGKALRQRVRRQFDDSPGLSLIGRAALAMAPAISNPTIPTAQEAGDE